MSPLSTRTFLATSLVLFTVLTAAMTFPQVLHLRDGVHDDGDPLLNAWALSWVAHQLPRAPAHLFDANIFYPERRTLAFSETLIVPALVAVPLQWLGVGPILVYNVVFLSGFIVSGVGTALLVRLLTGNTGAAIVGGIVFAFLPYRIDHYPHLQLQQTQCLPFALWAFHRLLRSGRLLDGVLVGVFTAGQILSCMYYGLFLLPYMAVVCGTLLVADRTWLTSRLTALLVAAAITIVAVVPVGRAYLGARKVVGERQFGEIAEGSATWWNYLGPPDSNLIYGKVFERFTASERRLFPGFVAVVLAAVALWPPLAAPRVAYVLGLLLAFDVSLGFNGFTYRVLYDYFLPFRGLRIPARMGVMAGFSLAVLAGYGAARVTDLLRSPGARSVALAAIGVLMLAEYASKPLELQTIQLAAPESYDDMMRDLGDSPTAPIFEFPVSAGDDPTYMYFSTWHWQSLVNGYSGFFPPSYLHLSKAMETFPDENSIQTMKTHGTRYLLVHGERLFGDRYETLLPQLDRRPDLTLVSRRPAMRTGQHGEISLYRVSYAAQ
jgi:hypothetical protein